MQIYVDEQVVVDKTCGYTAGRMLGAANQAVGKLGWGKRTTVSDNGNTYNVQDPTEVKIKGKVIVIVFESDHLRTGLGFGLKWSTRDVFNAYRLALEWSFVENPNAEDNTETTNTCLQTFSSARQNLLDCSRTRSCNSTESATSSSYICAAEDFKCKYGFHELHMG